jgi:hypothetical protein
MLAGKCFCGAVAYAVPDEFRYAAYFDAHATGRA